MNVEMLVSVVVAAGVLVLFLQNDIAFLFGNLPYRFLVVEQTERLIFERFPELIAKYKEAIAAKYIEKVSVIYPRAVVMYVKLRASHCMSMEECESVACAIQEDAPIMNENAVAKKVIQKNVADVKFYSAKQMHSELGAISSESFGSKIFVFSNLADA